MNEDQIERVVERSTNRADRRFMAGIMSQAEYDAEIAELNAWAQRKYDENRKPYCPGHNIEGHIAKLAP